MKAQALKELMSYASKHPYQQVTPISKAFRGSVIVDN